MVDNLSSMSNWIITDAQQQSNFCVFSAISLIQKFSLLQKSCNNSLVALTRNFEFYPFVNLLTNEVNLMFNDFDCEMLIDGVEGDSKRKGYEKHFKCSAITPSQHTYTAAGQHVAGATASDLTVDDVAIYGATQNLGGLRGASGFSKKTKIPKIVIKRLKKCNDKAEDQVVQELTMEGAVFTRFVPNDQQNTFEAVITYEKLEVKDHTVKPDGSMGSPTVNSYDRLTNVING